MEEISKRALRRHHRERLGKARKSYWAYNEHKPARVINTPCCCSCWMCGNPRKWGHLTIAERKASEAERCDLNE